MSFPFQSLSSTEKSQGRFRVQLQLSIYHHELFSFFLKISFSHLFDMCIAFTRLYLNIEYDVMSFSSLTRLNYCSIDLNMSDIHRNRQC